MSFRKIRVLEMIDDASIGGGQMHVYLLAKYLDGSRFDITVATEPEGFLVDKLKEIGISVLPVRMSNTLRLSSLFTTRRLLRDQQFDIIHTHGGTAGFWGRSAAVINGSPAVRFHTYHGFHYLHQANVTSKLFRLIDRYFLPATTRVICVCQSDLEQGINAGVVSKEKGIVVYNGIEAEKYGRNVTSNELRESFHAGENDTVFISVGRLHVQKGHRDLIRAFKHAAHQYTQSRLLIVGDGELRAELEGLARSLELQEKIFFLGNRKDIPELLQAADIFVLSSLWEGQPIALLEAMATGLPVIATNVNGIPEIISDGQDGLLVDAGSVDGMATAMKRMIADVELRTQCSLNGRARIDKEFSAQHMAQRVGDLYTRCIIQ
jgi:glycosyltransferase involved in cell wall biosynthesis